MKKTLIAGAVALTMGVAANASASTFSIGVTNMTFGSPTNAVTGTLTGTEGAPSGMISGSYFFAPWTATAQAVFDTSGSHNWAGSSAQGAYDYNFTLASGQAAFGLYFNWNNNNEIAVLAIFDCGDGSTGSTCTGIGGTGPNGGVPMQNGPFTGQDPSWQGSIVSGSISAVPVPAAVWLFGSGLMGLVGVARRRKA